MNEPRSQELFQEVISYYYPRGNPEITSRTGRMISFHVQTWEVQLPTPVSHSFNIELWSISCVLEIVGLEVKNIGEALDLIQFWVENAGIKIKQ